MFKLWAKCQCTSCFISINIFILLHLLICIIITLCVIWHIFSIKQWINKQINNAIACEVVSRPSWLFYRFSETMCFQPTVTVLNTTRLTWNHWNYVELINTSHKTKFERRMKQETRRTPNGFDNCFHARSGITSITGNI